MASDSMRVRLHLRETRVLAVALDTPSKLRVEGFRAPSWDQESLRDSGHEDSASARIAAGQRPRPSFRHPRVS